MADACAPVLRTRRKKKRSSRRKKLKRKFESRGMLFYPDENDWDRFWTRRNARKK